MIRINITVDSASMNSLLRLVKETGGKLPKKNVSSSYNSKGVKGTFIGTKTYGFVGCEFSDELVEEVSNFVIRYHSLVEDGISAIFAAGKAFMSLAKVMDKDLKALERKYLKEETK